MPNMMGHEGQGRILICCKDAGDAVELVFNGINDIPPQFDSKLFQKTKKC